MRSEKLAAYMVGAGVAGTLIILPYCGSAIFWARIPALRDLYIPFFLLPLIWGLWNQLHVRLTKKPSIGVWGLILGFIVSLVITPYLWLSGHWFSSAIIMPIYIPAVYYLIWHIVIGYVNRALGIGETI